MDGRTLHRIRNMCVWQPGRAGLDRSEQRRTEKDRAKKKAAFPLERAGGQATTREGGRSLKRATLRGREAASGWGNVEKRRPGTGGARDQDSKRSAGGTRTTHLAATSQPANLLPNTQRELPTSQPACLPAYLLAYTYLPTLPSGCAYLLGPRRNDDEVPRTRPGRFSSRMLIGSSWFFFPFLLSLLRRRKVHILCTRLYVV